MVVVWRNLIDRRRGGATGGIGGGVKGDRGANEVGEQTTRHGWRVVGGIHS